jgi:hypothetical protein
MAVGDVVMAKLLKACALLAIQLQNLPLALAILMALLGSTSFGQRVNDSSP